MKIVLATVAAAAILCAQQPPQVENAKFETRPLNGSLASQIKSFGAGPFWTAWSEPIIPGQHGPGQPNDMCRWGDNDGDGHAANAPVRLEGPTALVVLVRIENSQVDRMRVSSPDCSLDAGGLPFYWITSVPAAESVNWLRSEVGGAQMESAILAVSLHAGPAAERALDDFIAPSQPERVRERTAFWLGTSRGAHGVDVLKRMLATDPSARVREQAVFGLSVSRDPAALTTLIDAAKNNNDAGVRSKAVFWLAQKAANKPARDVIASAVVNDPDRSVKEQAVFALQQMPPDQGIPLLIDVAKNNPDPAVRKKAMFWLGQSKDQRALDFFAQVLRQ
jgi:hypothetical protein